MDEYAIGRGITLKEIQRMVGLAVKVGRDVVEAADTEVERLLQLQRDSV